MVSIHKHVQFQGWLPKLLVLLYMVSTYQLLWLPISCKYAHTPHTSHPKSCLADEPLCRVDSANIHANLR